ncbi:MAG: hypothetical protein M0R77_00375 [Gammaproteobacteria bacterium]|nr:hypothetical protein [Acholeplasmataceae bacterium]MCK9529009.1 hypothetical protein [Gammaproteobacteria bacterium]
MDFYKAGDEKYYSEEDNSMIIEEKETGGYEFKIDGFSVDEDDDVQNIADRQGFTISED